jgi:DAK2 domain fusion protein YloV
MSQEPTSSFDLGVFLRFADLATERLGDAREEINALNVYPVPDGDTGTNMFLTMSAARDGLVKATGGDPEGDLRAGLQGFTKEALLGARGNSGVILAQLLGGFATYVVNAPPTMRATLLWAHALESATNASYAAVGVPVEGTILTVARAASEAALAASVHPEHRLGHVVTRAADEAQKALDLTPEQLPILKQAGVVDAGGRGLVVILDAVATAVTGRVTVEEKRPRKAIPVPMPTGDLTAGGPSYEVMYLLDAADAEIPPLRQRLAPLGDSLVVVGGGGLWNVHVHVDDVGAALEAGIEAGRPHRVRVTHFAEQIDAAREKKGARRHGRKVVAVAAGPGLEALFGESGAIVVSAGPGKRPSVGTLVEAINASAAAEVILLPNDADTMRAAEIAARTAEESGEVRVAVIPSQAQVQGLAALAVHEPGRTFDQDVLEMTATARHARHGAITIAARQAITMAGPCEPGDVLGVIAGDFAAVGQEREVVALDIIERLIAGGGDLVTLVAGAEDDGLAARCATYLEASHPAVDVVVYDGGQERYPLLVSVE